MNATTRFEVSAFHGVGNTIDRTATLKEALIQTKLDFTVSQHDIITCSGPFVNKKDSDNRVYQTEFKNPSAFSGLIFPEKKAVIRDDTKQVLAILGNGYQIVQNEECFDIMGTILEESEKEGSKIELIRGGIVKNCDYIFIVGKLPHFMEIRDLNGNITNVHQYIVLQWSHTGASKVSISFVSYEPKFSCFLYPGGNEFQASARHSKNVKPRLEDASSYLKKGYKAFTSFSRKLQELANKEMSLEKCREFLDLLFSREEVDSKRGETVANNRNLLITSRFRNGNGASAFDAYSSICKYYDEDATVKQKRKDKDVDDLTPESELKLFSSLYGNGAKGKAEALTILSSFD